MRSLKNKVQLIGHLGQDPSINYLEDGSIKLQVSIATNEVYTNRGGEKVKETQWHNLIAWGKTAENMEKHLKKGSEVAILGKLIRQEYQDQEGNKRSKTEVLVSEFMYLSKVSA